jgi:hypothetical protein
MIRIDDAHGTVEAAPPWMEAFFPHRACGDPCPDRAVVIANLR